MTRLRQYVQVLTERYPVLRSDYFIAVLGAILVFSVITLYAFEVPRFSNTFNIQWLIGIALLLGALLGVYVGWKMSRYGEEEMEKVAYVGLSFFICIAIMPLLLSLTNRILSPFPVVEEKVEFVKASAYIGSRFGVHKGQSTKADGYHIFFIRNNRVERIKSKENIYPGVRKGTEVRLSVRRGLLGFDFATIK
ncbi:MAG: hypothetical protein AAGG75_14700 [Bacteroidota bacterium]